MKENVSIKVDEKTLKEIKSVYACYLTMNDGEYVFFSAKKGDVIITGFDSSKNKKTITFQGEGALKEAQRFDPNAIITPPKEKVNAYFIDYKDQIGSDEVGNGDFLLPMVVAASYVKESQINRIKELKIGDSKTLSDKRIRELGPIVLKEFAFSRMILSNDKYNQMYEKGENLNSLKAKMHNGVLNNLHKKYEDVVNIYIDQFVDPKTYYHYLKDDKEVVHNIAFKTKGESYFPCVALASIIARFTLLQYKDQLEEQYKMDFPFGASKKVDEFVIDFINKYSYEELGKICKKNFKNYQKL